MSTNEKSIPLETVAVVAGAPVRFAPGYGVIYSGKSKG